MKIKISDGKTEFFSDIASNDTVMSVLSRTGYILSTPCGGRGVCKKCLVKLVSGSVTADVGKDGNFLACSAKALSDIEIFIPNNSELIYDETDGTNRVQKTVKRAGIALDIGTTTLCVRLVDLDGRIAVESVSYLNPQGIMGADVISRIAACRQGKTDMLFSLINTKVSQIIKYFSQKYNLKIERMAVSGNTTMLHLFTNTDASSLGQLPFVPVFTERRVYCGKDLGLDVDIITLLPSFSAFVGADIVAGLAAIKITDTDKPAMLIDLGTNGEIAVFNKGRIFSSSTAAGPALEGAGISCGIGGVSGAVNSVSLGGGLIGYSTIGNTSPIGLCGCGLVDAVALMVKNGIVDETGAFSDKDFVFLKGKAFCIADGISVTDKDIRQFQLAKSAIRSGINIVAKTAGLTLKDIREVYIAGGLGYFINVGNAITSGLLPAIFHDRITVSGNLSLAGAEKSLYNDKVLQYCDSLLLINTTVDLASHSDFSDEFMNNMFFD